MKSSSNSERTRGKLRKILDHAVADVCLLSTTTRDYSRMLAKRQVGALQRLFEAQSSQLEVWRNRISEHAHKVSASAPVAGLRNLMQLTRIAPINSSGLAMRSMVAELVASHEDLANRLRADARVCAKRFSDFRTADFLSKLGHYHESTADTLRSLLSDERPQPVRIRVRD